MSITKKENNELPCYLSQKVINRYFIVFPSFLLMVLRDWVMLRFSCIFVRFSLSFFSLMIGAFFIGSFFIQSIQGREQT